MISPDENGLTPENSRQRSDYTGNFVEDIDNSAELEAIAKDPTIFPNSTRVYVDGQIHPDLKVPMREIRLSNTDHPNGRVEENPPIRVYDCSGPWGDPNFKGNVLEGLPALRRQWILDRADIEEYDGREVKAIDNGYLSEAHAEKYNENKAAKNKLKEYPGLKRKPLKSSGFQPYGSGQNVKPVTQKWYADQGVITPEMEFIAIRENNGRLEEFKTIHDHYPTLDELPEDASDQVKEFIRQKNSTPEGYEMPRPSEIDPMKQVSQKRHEPPAPRPDLWSPDPNSYHCRVRPLRGRPRPGHHPRQHQPPRKRAHDHRAEFPRQNQRQHRQLRRRLDHR